MKLIIDIDKDIYNHIVVDSEYFTPNLVNAFKNGTPILDNATNGDVIKAMFPNERIYKCQFGYDFEECSFDEEWWNAPYQKGGKIEYVRDF